MAEEVKSLSRAELYTPTDPSAFEFETTADLEELTEALGQPRAVEAVEFGVEIDQEGYNIFAMGPRGMGKRKLVRRYFEDQAAAEPVPPSWCYIHNFDDPHKPCAIHLPPGKGVTFREDMKDLVEDLQNALPAALESEEYQTRRQSIQQEFQEKQAEAFETLQRKAQEHDVALVRTPSGLAVVPVRDEEPLSPEELQELPEEEQEALKDQVEEIQAELQQILRQVPGWQSDLRERLQELDREVAQFAVGGLIDQLREKYEEYPKILDYLDDVQEDVVENAQDFLPQQEQENPLQQMLQGGGRRRQPDSSLRRYRVNVLVERDENEHAPVVYEDNPTYQNLIGRVEHRAQMGALLTDFNLIKPGALHRANGGYLILDARKVLTEPYAWDGLKRALQAGQLKIESIGQRLSLISTVSLEPEPIPLNVKVALLGERLLYYMLWQLDPEFSELFKVTADFEERMERDEENLHLYARLIGTIAAQEGLRPLDPTGVARVIEHSARVVGDSERLSTRLRTLADLLREASHWAGRADREAITAEDVQHAIDAQIYRVDRLRERVQEGILRETILIDTRGEEVGQVNGLSVISLGNFAFGRPTRITARTRLGKGEVIDIEREVELGGPIHSKGVLILSGFLGARYAEDYPLSLSASLVFEQSYGGIEGDSASSAELYALLSSLAQVPIQQSLAVTGSVNQRGDVQAIGGVNEKIEGFFDICEARGLTGEQGVLIPRANVKHLMLRRDVVEAVEAGQFHVYPVETINQGIEILTGMPAGERDEAGNYPEGTFNHRVEERLRELAEERAQFSKRASEEEPS
jgi:lon-related putative ATP-dependent protease